MYPTLAQLKAVFRLSPTGPPYQPGSYLIWAFPPVQTGPLLGYRYRSPGTGSAFIPFLHTAFRPVPVPLFGQPVGLAGFRFPFYPLFSVPLSDRSRYRFIMSAVGLSDRFRSGPLTGPVPLYRACGFAFRYRKNISKPLPVPLFRASGRGNRNYRKTIPNKKGVFSCLRNAKFGIRYAL